MFSRLFFPLIAALLVILLTSCSPGTSSPATPTATSEPADWQLSIDEATALTAGLAPPEHLLQENAVKRAGDFDPNAFFSVLDRLSLEPGYALDYVYWYDEMGGKPVLYAREAETPPFETFAEYEQARDEPAETYLDHVQMDGSAEGFFQLLLLRLLGDRFYLWWHAVMDDDAIITDQVSLEAHLEKIVGDCIEPTGPVLEQSASLDLEPRVEFEEEQVNIEVAEFTRWGGLLRKTYTFSRPFPHRLLGETEQPLIPYECGVVP